MHKDIFHNLQLIQLRHDQLYHADILCLPVQRRANHMALHFAKYAGKLTEAKLTKNSDLFSDTLVDTFVICLASANMFNVEIGELAVFKEVQTKNFEALGAEIFSFTKYVHDDPVTFLADNMTIFSGRMAKSIESLDHMEPYPFREEFEECLESIIGTVFVSSAFKKIDLVRKTKERLEFVEKKSIFYSDNQPESLNKKLG